MAVVRAVVVGVLVGVVLGALARALMHLVDVGMGLDVVFELAPSVGVVGLFVLAATGSSLARTFDLVGWRLALVLAIASAPLLVLVAVFAVTEIQEILERDLTPPWTAELIAMVAVIAGVTLVTPYAAWRASRPGRGG